MTWVSIQAWVSLGGKQFVQVRPTSDRWSNRRKPAVPEPRSLSLLASAGASVLAGCDDTPAPGTTASPVDKEEAAKQSQAMEHFYRKARKGTPPRKYAEKAPP